MHNSRITIYVSIFSMDSKECLVFSFGKDQFFNSLMPMKRDAPHDRAVATKKIFNISEFTIGGNVGSPHPLTGR